MFLLCTLLFLVFIITCPFDCWTHFFHPLVPFNYGSTLYIRGFVRICQRMIMSNTVVANEYISLHPGQMRMKKEPVSERKDAILSLSISLFSLSFSLFSLSLLLSFFFFFRFFFLLLTNPFPLMVDYLVLKSSRKFATFPFL